MQLTTKNVMIFLGLFAAVCGVMILVTWKLPHGLMTAFPQPRFMSDHTGAKPG